jgi:hypothetical protein
MGIPEDDPAPLFKSTGATAERLPANSLQGSLQVAHRTTAASNRAPAIAGRGGDPPEGNCIHLKHIFFLKECQVRRRGRDFRQCSFQWILSDSPGWGVRSRLCQVTVVWTTSGDVRGFLRS